MHTMRDAWEREREEQIQKQLVVMFCGRLLRFELRNENSNKPKVENKTRKYPGLVNIKNQKWRDSVIESRESDRREITWGNDCRGQEIPQYWETGVPLHYNRPIISMEIEYKEKQQKFTIHKIVDYNKYGQGMNN